MAHCEKCGRELPPDHPPGAPCPGCVGRGSTVELPAGVPATLPSEEASKIDLPPETAFGPYRIEREIGRGGMGVVYKAREAALGRDVALKILLAGERATTEQASRFLREARSAAGLSHPNIVPVYAAGSEKGVPYFAMEFIEGSSLEDLARRGLEVGPAVGILRDAARALHYSHQKGIVHRDIKPANILIDREGRPRITDFGLAKVMGDPSGFTVEGTTLGTPAYMSPEQAAGRIEQVGPSSDVYSLGAVFYEVLTGRPPFQSETPFHLMAMIQTEPPVPPGRLRPGIPRDVQVACLKAIEKKPSERYADMAAFADDLDRIARGEPILARAPSPLARAWRWARRQRTALLAAALAFLATAFVGVLLVVRPGFEPDSHAPPMPPRPGPPRGPRVSPEARQAASAKMDRGRSMLDRAERSYSNPDPARRREHLEEALKAFTEATVADPNHAEAFCGKGRVLALLERSPEAFAAFDRALELNPALTDAYYGRVQIRYKRYQQTRLLGGQESPASLRTGMEADLARIEEIGAKPEMYHCGRGALLAVDGRTKDALAEFDRALAANDSFADAHAAKAGVHLMQGLQEPPAKKRETLQRALDEYTSACQFSGGAIEHRSGRAQALLALNRREEALQEADAMVAAMGDKPWPYLLRAYVRKALDDEKGYDEDMDKADAFPYDDPDIHFAVAGMLLSGALQGGAWRKIRPRDIDRALHHIELLLQKYPERTDIRGLRGFACMLTGRRAEAVADLEVYLEKNGNAQLAPAARLALAALKGGGDLSINSFAATFQAGMERLGAGDEKEGEALLREALKAFDAMGEGEARQAIAGVPLRRLAAQGNVELARIAARRSAEAGKTPEEQRAFADEALGRLDRAAALGFRDARRIDGDPDFVAFRGDPRFEDVLAKMR